MFTFGELTVTLKRGLFYDQYLLAFIPGSLQKIKKTQKLSSCDNCATAAELLH